jgi:hypothetical protein
MSRNSLTGRGLGGAFPTLVFSSSLTSLTELLEALN